MEKKNRQSVDFGEVWNIQTDMNVTQEKWDLTFHNWEHPSECCGSKRTTGCAICDRLKKDGIYKAPSGKASKVNVLIIGDIHTNIAGVQKLIDNNPDVVAAVAVGDVSLWKDVKDAKDDKKAWSHCKDNIEAFVDIQTKLSIPLYVIKGNHDDYNNMYTDWFKDLNIFYMQQADVLTINNLKIGCLGGIYSSLHTLEDASTFKNRINRFYTIAEIEDLKAKDFNVLITHQAADGMVPDGKMYEGSTELKDLLDSVKPDLYIHGHHHINYEVQYNNTKVYGLGNFSKNENSYLKINSLTNVIYR